MITGFKKLFVEPIRRRALRPELELAIPVLVYQMGKVASSTIHGSIEPVYPGWVIQIHEYEPDKITKRKLKRRMVFDWARKEGKPLDIVTLTREPIGRNVAWLFENYTSWTKCDWSDPNIKVADLERYFHEEFDQDYPLVWFDENIKKYFGIDCYSKPFSHQGWQVYQEGNVRVLAMQCELPDDSKQSLLQDFLKIDEIPLIQKNVGAKKPYATLYKDFRETVKFSEKYLRKMCDSRYFQHFYSSDVIQKVYERWR